MSRRHAFTLLEMIMAIAACALILSALYGVFSRAIHLRDDSAEHARAARVRARISTVLRNDLRHALVSGGVLAKSLQGTESGQNSSFPGYLKITTTTATDPFDLPSPDVQQIEYYIVNDPAAANSKAGVLVRAVNRNLLAQVAEVAREEPLLAGTTALEVGFYDGQNWQPTWEVTTDEPALPQAVRVRVQLEAPEGQRTGIPPIEIYVPWTTASAILPAATPAGTPAP